ncbi:MAG TPA: hypothetical protein VKQ32_06130 [Polyangia bacterium]|nr:hypothetical protein [Polyangia bacterium]
MIRPAAVRWSWCLAALFAGGVFQVGCGGARTSTYTKIDDMEGPGPFIEWTAGPGTTQGFWYTATDCSEDHRISPPPDWVDASGWSYAALPAPQETMPGTMSTHAVRFRTTSPLVGIWGANVGFDFANPASDGGVVVGPSDAGASINDAGACAPPPLTDYPIPTADLTAYAGVTFWARAESPGGSVMRVHVLDVNTDPRGGICNGQDTNAPDYCFNGFGVDLQLTETFRQYTLDFSQFTQRGGWGYHPPAGNDWSRVYLMVFEMDLPSCAASATTMCAGGAPSLSFDYWIDDVYFVNK